MITGHKKMLTIILVENGYKIVRGDDANHVDEYVAMDHKTVLELVTAHLLANDPEKTPYRELNPLQEAHK